MNIFPVGAGTALVSDVFGVITDNLPTVLTVLGAMVGLAIVARLVNGGIHGKVKVGR